jgi:serine/threonine protein kinase
MSHNMCHPEIYCVFCPICDGVEYLHKMGLAHRDHKLDNCVMTSANVVKLIDFGTATVFHYPGGKARTLVTGIIGSQGVRSRILRSTQDRRMERCYHLRVYDPASLSLETSGPG